MTMFGLAVCAGLCLQNIDQIFCKLVLFFKLSLFMLKLKQWIFLIPLLWICSYLLISLYNRLICFASKALRLNAYSYDRQCKGYLLVNAMGSTYVIYQYRYMHIHGITQSVLCTKKMVWHCDLRIVVIFKDI